MFFAEQLNSILLTLFVIGVPTFRHLFFHTPTRVQNALFHERIAVFDILKGISITAVIVIHVVYVFLINSRWENHPLFFLWINNVSRFAIPIFLICSGVLLTEEKTIRGWVHFFQKKAIRIFLPFLFANLVLAFHFHSSFAQFWYDLISGNALVPYYFIVVLAQCYALYPLLIRARHTSWLLPLAFLISLASFLIPPTWELGGFPMVFQYLFFFVYGIVRKNEILSFSEARNQLWKWDTLIGADVAIAFVFPGLFYNARFFYGIAVFWILVLVLHQKKSSRFSTRFFALVGTNSLWIYLTHFPVVILLFRLGMRFFAQHELAFFLVLTPMVTTASILVAWVFHVLSQKLRTLLLSITENKVYARAAHTKM